MFIEYVNMKIRFSNHAEEQIRERNLSRALIIQTVQRPDKVVKQLNNRYRAQKLPRSRGKKYLLIVIYDVISDTQDIVTAFITSKLKKYL